MEKTGNKGITEDNEDKWIEMEVDQLKKRMSSKKLSWYLSNQKRNIGRKNNKNMKKYWIKWKQKWGTETQKIQLNIYDYK